MIRRNAFHYVEKYIKTLLIVEALIKNSYNHIDLVKILF